VSLAYVASHQHGVVTVAELRGRGLGDTDIRYRGNVGRLHRLHRGIYAVGHPRVSREGW